MKIRIILLFALNSFFFAHGQDEKTNHFNVLIGANYNLSSTDWMPTTGIGLYVEPSYTFNDIVRLNNRFEPTALAYGVLVLPGGCGGECREGANYVLGNYLKAEYLIGKPKIGNKGGRHQGYIGLSFNVVTHKRWIITSREPGRWTDTYQWVANPGLGFRAGALLGRLDISAAYNVVGGIFQDYLGVGLGYRILNK